jgi:hypothetical protein
MKHAPFLTLATVLAIATPAAANDLEGTVSVFATPMFQRHAGASLEARLPAARLSLTGVGAAEFDSPARYYSLYSRWTPLAAGPHSFGPLLGYYQVTSTNRFGLGTTNSLLVGVVYQWEEGAWWTRVSPYIGLNVLPYMSVSPAIALLGSFGGPPLFEVGWRPVPHLELALRTSFAPLRVGFVW